jgi:protein FrlC
MKFGVMSIDFKRFPLEYCFRMASTYLFDGVEIFGVRSHFHPDDLTPEKVKSVLQLKTQFGLEVPMYTPNVLNQGLCICSSDAHETDLAVKFYQKGIDVAHAIECEKILVVADHPGYQADREETWAQLVDSMKAITSYGAGKGVQVIIEPLTPMESPVVTTVDDCVKLIADVGLSNLYSMLDVVPPVIAQEPFSKYFELLGEKLVYIHICNTDGKTDAHMGFDAGILPIADVFQVFQNWNYAGYVTTEFYSENYRDPELLLANTTRFLDEIRKEIKG